MAAETLFNLQIKVTGGRRHTSILSDVRGRALDSQLYVEMARRFVREFPMSLLLTQLPELSGNLKRSVKLIQRGARVYLQYDWYGPFQSVSIESVYHDLAAPVARRVARQVIREAFG